MVCACPFLEAGRSGPYTLPASTYVVLSTTLRRALAVVRAVQSAPLATKQALLRCPGAVLREALGDDTDDTVIESAFRETAAYSDRVIGLGLWSPRVVPWVPLPSTNWLGGETAEGAEPARQPPREAGLMIGDRCVPLDAGAADDLRTRIEAAIGAEISVVSLEVGGEIILVPATHETLAALHALEASRLPSATKPPPASRNR